MAKRVLVVDDDPHVLALLAEVLDGAGYRVATARDQIEASEHLRAARPDLLLLDLVLGEPAGGWAILEGVRRDPDLASLPVVVCTADVFSVAQRAADLRRLRAEVLTKPFHVAELVAAVRRLIGPA